MKNRRIFLSRIFLTALLTLLSSNIFTQEYEVFGTIKLEQHYPVIGANNLLEENQDLGWNYILDSTHRLALDKGEFSANHTLQFGNYSLEEQIPNFAEQVWASQIHWAYFLFNPIPSLNITIGRRKTPWGTGGSFAPGDRINPFALSFQPEKGFDGLTITWEPQHWISLKSIVSVDQVLDSTGDAMLEDMAYGSEASVYWGLTELSAAIQYRPSNLLRPSGSLSTDLWGNIFSLEAGVELNNPFLYPIDGSLKEKDSPAPFLDVSLQRSFYTDNWTFTLIGEYYFQGEGYSEKEKEQLLESPTALLSFNDPANQNLIPPFLRQNYTFLSLGITRNDYFNLEASGFINLDDQSYMIMPHLQYIGIEGMDLGARLVALRGENTSEFGAVPMSDIWFYISLYF